MKEYRIAVVPGDGISATTADGNVLTDAGEAISARRAGKEADLLALYFPNSWDGLLGIRFVNSIIESSNANGKWIKC